jgi:hypothetical protein
MAYIGRDISNLSDRAVLDNITTSATATFNLLLNGVAYVPSSAESLTVSLNGIIQKPQSSYTVNNATIVFDSALTSSDSIDFILAERAITLTTVGTGSVGTSQLVDSAVTNAKITDGTIANAKLANSSITLNGSAVSLGGSATIGGGGKIGQVIQSVVTTSTAFTTSHGTFIDIGLSASITPSATDSKILVNSSINFGTDSNSYAHVRLLRGSTNIALGDADGNRTRVTAIVSGNDLSKGHSTSLSFLDSPSTTSSTTFKLQVHNNSNQTWRLNGEGENYNGGGTGRAISTMTLMEVLA